MEEEDIYWKKDKAYYNNILIGTIVPHKVHKDMWCMQPRDHQVSRRFYNKTRARDNFNRIFNNEENKRIRNEQSNSSYSTGSNLSK